MGYFDGLVAGSFKTSREGEPLFYPWGTLGKGYVLDAPTAQRLRRILKLSYLVMLPLIVLLVNMIPWTYVLAAMVVGTIVYYIGVRFCTRGLQVSPERLKLVESLTNSAKAHNPATLGFMFACALFFVIAGIFMLFSRHVGIGLLSVVFFGACAAAIGYMLSTRS